MIAIDHICLGVRNIYEGAHRLRTETGFGNYDGGWFPQSGLANRIVPLGDDTYIEVEGVVDAYKIGENASTASWFHRCVKDGDVYIGWCARVESRSELDAIAKRLGVDVLETALKTRPDGGNAGAARVPDAVSCWAAGKPNFFHFPDMARHAARQPVGPGGHVVPRGLAWMEIGGSAEEMSDWLGTNAAKLSLRFNGAAAGLYAIGIRTDEGETVIRRPNHRAEF
jgi:hypothetical protein